MAERLNKTEISLVVQKSKFANMRECFMRSLDCSGDLLMAYYTC